MYQPAFSHFRRRRRAIGSGFHAFIASHPYRLSLIASPDYPPTGTAS